MGSFARSWDLARQSWGVLKRNPSLSVFPIVSSVVTLLLTISFFVPLYLILKPTDLKQMPPVGYVVSAIFYLVSYFVVIFFNVGLVHCARKALAGEPTTFSDGMKAASSKLGPILIWTLIAATVGWVLHTISERSGIVGRIIIAILGAAWNVLTFFVIPVLVFENVGPIEAIKRSGSTMSKTWGTSLIGNAGIGLAIFLLGLIPIPLIIIAVVTGSVIATIGALRAVPGREIAKQAIERLIADGRIHPARIEEVVEKVKAEMDESVRKDGEAAAFELGMHDLHPELQKLMGRLKYRTSYGQNVLNHSKEVAYLAGIMAKEIGLDANVAVRAAFLHDCGKAIDRELQGTHLEIGIDLLRKHGESEAVVLAMAAHHMDIDWPSLEAMIVQAADAISAARPGARRDILESYVKRLEKLEEIADSFKGVSKAFALQAGREIRIMVESEKITDEEAVWLSKDIARRIENELEYPGHIKVTVIRETRAVEYAK